MRIATHSLTRALLTLLPLAVSGCFYSAERNPESPPTASNPATDPPAALGAFAPRFGADARTARAARDTRGTYLTWIEKAGEGHRLRTSHLDFATGTWSSAETIAEGAGFFANWADVPAAIALESGARLAGWPEKGGQGTYAYSLALAVSARGPAPNPVWARRGFLPRDTSETEHGFLTFLAEADGARAFWLDGHATAAGKPMALHTARVDARGQSDGEIAIDDSVCDCCPTAAAWTSEGPIVAYRDRTAGEIRDIHVARRDARGGWTNRAVHRDGWKIEGCPVNGPAIAAEGSRVALAWFTGGDPAPRVLAAFSTDAGASFGAPIEVDSSAPIGRVDLALDRDGSAIVAWYGLSADTQTSNLNLVRVRPEGKGATIHLAQTSSARASGIPRLALDREHQRIWVAWVETGSAESANPAGRLRTTAVALDSLE